MSSKRQRTAAGGSSLPSKPEVKEEPQAKRVKKDAKEVQVQQSPRAGNEGLTMGGLPLYGESCPKNGYAGIPGLAEDACSLLRQTMEKAKDLKDSGKVRV